MKILITSGPMRESIDSARYIGNHSTGKTGAALASHFQKAGLEVVFLYGEGSKTPEGVNRMASFRSFQNLDLLLKKTLGEEKFDAVIHLAAVSDYSLGTLSFNEEVFHGPFPGKIHSEASEIKMTLVKNPKILDRLKNYGSMDTHEPIIIGFKLTDSQVHEDWYRAVESLYASGQVDLVVHNDISQLTDKNHVYRLIRANRETRECVGQDELALLLETFLTGDEL